MRRVKVGIAFCASAVGVLLPGRARVIYSEILGWVAQVVPPVFYEVDQSGDSRRS